jgi:membrane-bound ClpP family serine protease
MPDPVKHALLGALILAGVIFFIPALITFGFAVLAVVGTLAIVRKLFPNRLLPETSTTDGEDLKRAKTTSQPNTPGRPR